MRRLLWALKQKGRSAAHRLLVVGARSVWARPGAALVRLHPYFRRAVVSERIESVEAYAGQELSYVGPEHRTYVYALPKYLPLDPTTDYGLVELPAPRLYVARLSNVRAVGSSNVILAPNGIALNDMYVSDPERRLWHTDFGFSRICNRSGYVVTEFRANRPTVELECGVLLSANYSYNYYHFTVEILPRLMHLDGCVPAEVPLVIDRNMRRYPQFEELLALFNRSGREVVEMELDRAYRFGTLYYPSIAPYIVPNVVNMTAIRPTDNLYDPQALAFVRNRLLETRSNKTFPQKIFLARLGGVRMFNQEEVFERLAPLGFEQVATDQMSVADQVALFAGAEQIVAGSGAVLTNLLYCSPGCKVLVAVNCTYPHITIFSTLASFVGADLVYLSAGAHVSDDRRIVHRDFRIDPNEVLKVVKQW